MVKTIASILLCQNTDDPIFVKLLTQSGFSVITSDEENIERNLYIQIYDIVLFNIESSNNDDLLLAIEAARLIKPSALRVAMLSGDNTDDIILAYNYGADDCIIKPYNFDLLVYKLKALIARHGTLSAKAQGIVNIGRSYKFDTRTGEIMGPMGFHECLSPKEALVLSALCTKLGTDEYVTDAEIARIAWPDDPNAAFKRLKANIRAQIKYIRKYFILDEHVQIVNRTRLGWRIVILNDEDISLLD